MIMSCTELLQSFGFSCTVLESAPGEKIHCISTPFKSFDGDGVYLFAEYINHHIRFFDSGDTMFHIAGGGIQFKDHRSWKHLENIVNSFGASFENGEIFSLVSSENAKEGFNSALTAILAVHRWHEENAGLPYSTISLAAEVEAYLKLWKPGLPIFKDKKVKGISGRDCSFNFELDGEFIDVISSSAQSTAAEIKKLVDVRAKSVNENLVLRVLLDDRGNEQRAKEEASIISRFAETTFVSSLISKIGNNTTSHIMH